ncbi:MAG: hypothetical protein OEM30_06135 [Gammaproteobacteria bacterium]|jgi:hypothetical protein|nr:hypothetical protein [Gammaproteobacteria bacterium]
MATDIRPLTGLDRDDSREYVRKMLGGNLFSLLFPQDVRKDAEHTQDALERLDFEKRFR